jgi:putative acetyltransferase
LLLFSLVFITGCNQRPTSSFAILRSDPLFVGTSAYPLAADPKRVGSYPLETKSGAGYFYDDVLEYRVWLHPENGADAVNGGSDYFVAFAQYERALGFTEKTRGAEQPLVLVRQLQWIDEPAPQHYVPEKGERLTEWQVPWLDGSKRAVGSIDEFLKHPRGVQH